jgi:hypothetical protein
VQRKLVVYRTLTVTYTFAGGSTLPAVVATPYYRAYAGGLLNFGYLGISPGDQLPLKFMIVLGEDSSLLRESVEPLRVWKAMQGYDAQVHCVGSEIPRNEDAIKAWIASWYNPQAYQLFVLLVGDHDLIPSPPGWAHPVEGFIYSDHWYACVAGDDDIADVDLGRISSSDPVVVSAVVLKEMHYERSTDPNWENTRFLAVAMAEDPTFWWCKESVAVRLERLGIECIRQYGMEPFVTNVTLMSKIDFNSAGGCGTVNYRGHGLAQGWPEWNSLDESFMNSEVLQLTNPNWLPLVYEICCSCGNIDPWGEEEEGHSETWVEHIGGGGVAAWGATRPVESGHNTVLDTFLCTIPFRRQITYTTVVMNAAKMEVLRRWQTPMGHATNQQYHLMGDPSLHVWMADSGGLDLNFSPKEICPWRPYFIDAHVTRHGGTQPVRDAAVGVYKPDDILGSARTDVNGDAQIYVYAHSGGIIEIAASKPLFHGDEDVILVNPEGGPQGTYVTVPREFSLWVPPVARGELRLRAEIPLHATLRLTVCDAMGRVIAAVPNLQLSAGYHWIRPVWSVTGHRGLAPGSYFVRYESDLGCGLLKTLVVR